MTLQLPDHEHGLSYLKLSNLKSWFLINVINQTCATYLSCQITPLQDRKTLDFLAGGTSGRKDPSKAHVGRVG